jgi:RNA polymerase primary sigma factor
VGSRNNFTLLNVLEDANAEHADVRVEGQMLTAEMVRRMDRLDERQRTVISRYYGIGAERQTMSEIAEVLGLKRERVRQVRNQALRKLKR